MRSFVFRALRGGSGSENLCRVRPQDSPSVVFVYIVVSGSAAKPGSFSSKVPPRSEAKTEAPALYRESRWLLS